MKDIIFATGNKAKIAQINFIKDHFQIDIDIINGKKSFGDDVEYEENQDSAAEIAKFGAIDVAKRIGKPVIAEDTDLWVEALDGFPGVRAGLFLKDFGRSKLLKIMKNQSDRRAKITSACCFAMPDGTYKNFVNVVNGTLTNTEIFDDHPDWISPYHSPLFGGGYNAIFKPDNSDKTLAQIAPEDALEFGYREKNFLAVLNYIRAL